MIATERLRLIPIEGRHRRAFHVGRGTLARLLGVSVPDDWPHYPEALALLHVDADPAAAAPGAWGGYFFIDPAQRALIGNGGFHGAPNSRGEVEIGYEIAPAYRNRGFATEVARALVRFAFADARVSGIVAHTLPEENASTAVLAKLGLRFAGERTDPEVGVVWHWYLARS
jgi:RimJ/RimL family protein N-acetyltransferase